MKSKFTKVLLLAICCIMIFGGIIVDALIPYSTYTYDVDGWYQPSPDAYVPLTVISSSSIKGGLNDKVNEMATQLYGDKWVDIQSLCDIFVDKLVTFTL
jgi:hypothetical protein